MNAEAARLLALIEQSLADADATAKKLAAMVDEAAPLPTPEESSNGLADPAAFYNWLRADNMLGPKISASEYEGCEATLKAAAARGHPIAFAAYDLGTDYHETAHTLQPVNEFGGSAYYLRLYDINGQRPELAKKMGNTEPGDGIKFHGRGKVQLTWKVNYKRAGDRLGIDLVGNPDLALGLDVSARVLCIGMEEGWFTGKKLSDYLPESGQADRAAFTEARRIVNGTDRADLVAGYAMGFQRALVAGGYLRATS